MSKRSIATKVGDPRVACKNPYRQATGGFASWRDLVAGELADDVGRRVRSIANRGGR